MRKKTKQNSLLNQSFLSLVETECFLDSFANGGATNVAGGVGQRGAVAFRQEAGFVAGRKDGSSLQRGQTFSFEEYIDYSYLEFNKTNNQKVETPSLIRANFIPEYRKAFNSDIVRKGSLPAPRVHRPTFHSTLRGSLSPNRTLSQDSDFTVGFNDRSAPTQQFSYSQNVQIVSRKSAFNGAGQRSDRSQKMEAFFSGGNVWEEEGGEDIFEPENYSAKTSPEKSEFDARGKQTKEESTRPWGLWRFATVALGGAAVVFGFVFVSYAFQLKSNLEKQKTDLSVKAKGVKIALKENDLESLSSGFESIQVDLRDLQKQVDALGGDALDLFSSLPYLSRFSSGKNLIEAGNNLADAGKDLTPILANVNEIRNPFAAENQNSQSLTEIFLSIRQDLIGVKEKLILAEGNLQKVKAEDLPESYREKVVAIKKAIPQFITMIDSVDSNGQIFLELLGHNGPRKYLLLFQNNDEMRATGGFIGSYGLLSLSNGKVKDFKIEGIYNPDGQLQEKIIPPEPIQKISAGWSTHDANWFPHFPTSAQKVAWFYEKTGGPTIDGVIALTPNVLQKMLELTGPIAMENYNKTITPDNFNLEIRRSIEQVDQENKAQEKESDEMRDPKGVLADLAPKLLSKMFETKDPQTAGQLLKLLSESLTEKQMIFYSTNEQVQKIISEQGWAGEILQTPKDYLMVVNTNINGFKTDRVIDELIDHQLEVQENQDIVATVKIKRTHNGGQTEYDQWNKVNADYMRVYVPKGSKLLSVSGQVREFTDQPIDYKRLGFREDPDVKDQESKMLVNFDSGTRIYEEEGKAVFANWTYVSPGETAEVTYRYQLPFKWSNEPSKSYSVLYQKQAGSTKTKIDSTIKLPVNEKVTWRYPDELAIEASELKFQTDLVKDRFLGFVCEEKEASRE